MPGHLKAGCGLERWLHPPASWTQSHAACSWTHKRSKPARRAATRAISRHCRSFRTITFNSGTEFHDYALREERFPVKTYFATPYHSWERGSNENFNGWCDSTYPRAPAGVRSRRLNAIASPMT